LKVHTARGMGWLTRKAGLSCDKLVSAEVVTADGTVLRVSADDTGQPLVTGQAA
jgi:FAD/FMN-containing dehydrogenase